MTVRLEKVGKRIHVQFPYDPSDVNAVKSVPGASWSKTGRVWTFPLEMSVCRGLREAFGSRIEIGTDLGTWAAGEVAREKQLAEYQQANDADLVQVPHVSPVLDKAMSARTYQRAGAAFIAHGRSVLIADQPGLGKTLETLAGIVEAQAEGHIMIVSLKTAMDVVWRREIQRWLPEDVYSVHVAHGTAPQREATIDAWKGSNAPYNFLIVNPQMIRLKVNVECVEGKCNGYGVGCKSKHLKWSEGKYPQLFDIELSGVVIDESAHAQSSLVAESANMKKWSQFRVGAATLNIKPDGVRIALSGTPMRGKPRNMWGTLNWLRPELYTAFWKWANRHFHVVETQFGMEIGGLRDEEGFTRELSSVMLRRTKAEVLKDLPPKQYGGTPLDPQDPNSVVGVWVPMEGAQLRAYKAMQKNAKVALEGGTLSAVGALAELTRLKQFANSAGVMDGTTFVPSLPSNKIDTVLDMLADRGIEKDGEGDSKVVIFSQFTSMINLTAKVLRENGIKCHVLTGETKAGAERERLITEFQEDDETRVFLVNTNAGGVALTLDRADDMFILDETWIPDDQEQAEDRLHRASRNHQVTIYYIRSLGSVEENIARDNEEADDLQKRLMDGSRGVALAKKFV